MGAVGMAALAAAGSAAADPSTSAPCGSSFNPYDYTAAAVEECGTSVSTSAVTTQLPDGGSETTYTTPSEAGATSLYSPPAGFDPATASAAQLAEYGFATPLASAGLPAFATWQTALSAFTTSPVNPSFLASGNASADVNQPAAGAYPGTSGNWSGYQANTGGFTFSYSSWTEPTYGRSVCPNNSAVIWDGIGGANGDADLGQDGSAHGEGNQQPGGSNHQMWEEVLPQQKTIQPLPVIGIAGDRMYANTSWNSSTHKYTGTVGDITTNTYKNWSRSGNWTSADTAEAVAERSTYMVNGVGTLLNLSNFETMSFLTSGGNQTPMNGFSKANRTGLEMVDGSGKDMANVSGVGANGALSDTQHSCK